MPFDSFREKFAHGAIVAAVVGASYAALVAAPSRAADEKQAMEKCYGVAKAGENSCASANGSHSCSGQAKTDYDGQNFKAVPAGTCAAMGGSLTAFAGQNPKKVG